jgi:hypothetical protein
VMRRTRFFSTIFFVCFALYSVINVLSAVSLTADRYPSSSPHSHAVLIRDTRQPSTHPSTHSGPAFRRATYRCRLRFCLSLDYFIPPFTTNFTRLLYSPVLRVEMRGFEPLASAVQRRRSPI